VSINAPVSQRATVVDGAEQAIEVGGVRGRYTVTGSGEPLVLLATTLVRARPYAPVIRRLASRFRVTAIDLPGCGGADRLPRTWTFEEYARWTGGALEVLGIERATLVGHSNSAGIALVAAAAALSPERVRRLVLADAVGAESPSYWQVILGRVLDGILEPRLSFTGWHHLAFNAIAHTRNFFGQIKASIERDLRAYAPQVTVPTLVAWGARDHTMPPHCADALRRLLPRPYEYVSPTGSHDWIITNAAEFADAVGAFVDKT
jgi:pimeloyl-ACP methyl ester carboxylesterase